MPATSFQTAATVTPRLLLAAFGPYGNDINYPGVEVIARLISRKWSPDGASLIACLAPVSWAKAPDVVIAAAETHACQAVLLVAPNTRGPEVRVEMRAQNRASRRKPDADGQVWDRDRIAATGPGVVRSTAPVAEIMRAIKVLGQPVRAGSEAGDFVGNLTFYRLLTDPSIERSGRLVGCMRLPLGQGVETAEQVVKAAVTAFAARLMVDHSEMISA